VSYNRDSFDRFGDDLCELILSYLTLNDCLEYQCVNKQWKRLVFNKQMKLIIDNELPVTYTIKSTNSMWNKIFITFISKD
jgi:hypothetical protein